MASTSTSTPPSSSASPIHASLSPQRAVLNASLLTACSAPDLPTVISLLDQGADAWWEEEETGWSGLHFAAEAGDVDVVKVLLRRGAIWNAVDRLGITAGEVAWSMNHAECYRAIFDEGVRTELLLNLIGRKGQQASGPDILSLRPDDNVVATDNEAFLKSRLEFTVDEKGKERALDVDGNCVMAAWESDIMRETAKALCESHGDASDGLSILNIGFGLGIVDEEFQRYSPKQHTIIEAHPDAIAHAKSKGWYTRRGVRILEGRWQDFINDPELGTFDVIYFDTYSEDYAELRTLFDELPNLLNGPSSRFSFFHGLGATNQFFYDIYTRITELDLRDIGLSCTWHEVEVGEMSEEVWKGVLRKYWTLEKYRFPIASLGF